MKTKHLILALLSLAVSPLLHAEEKGQKPSGPNGGRIVTTTDPHFEFLVTPERKLKITFLSADNKPTALQQQTATAIGGDRAAPTQFTFTKEGETLVSDKALPAGNETPIVIQIKLTPDAKSITTKFNINLANCPSCDHAEYACTCEH